MVQEALRDSAGVTLVVASPALTQHHGKDAIKPSGAGGTPAFSIYLGSSFSKK